MISILRMGGTSRQAIFLSSILQRNTFLLPATTSLRSAHNDLYELVKKRTIEARTKMNLDGSHFGSQACNISNEDPANIQNPGYLRTNVKKYVSTPTPIENKCINTEILRATCNVKPPECPPPPPPKCERLLSQRCETKRRDPCKPPDKPKSNMTPIILGILAAMGAGGLMWWLLNNKEEPPIENKCETTGTIPASSSELPKHVPYILVGGGTASFSAFRAIKANDPKAKVLVISNELRKPYMRPPLSKELWYSAQHGEVSKDYRFKQWTGSERSLYFEPEEFFVHPTKLMDTANGGIAVAQGFTVRKVDPDAHTVILSDGYEITYDECLIATGCSPKNLPQLENAPMSVREKVILYRTPDDFERLKGFVDMKKSITIVGNGFTGSELACSLANYSKGKGNRIYQIYPESGNMSRVLPEYLSKWTMKKIESQGVCVFPNVNIKDVQRDDSLLKVVLNNGQTLLTDIVVVCVGCSPNTSIANLSGLETNKNLGGFVVNAELEARRNLFVAGDVSCFYDPILGRRRLEHHDHSVVSGRLAGENMVGKKKAYTHQSMFWSDLGPEIGYEGIGLVDSTLPTVGVFALASVSDKRTNNLSESDSIDGSAPLPPPSDSGVKAKKIVTETDKKTTKSELCLDEEDQEKFGRGVIFYLKDEKVVGILLWNLFNRIGLARTIINENKKYEDLNEVAKLFEIHA